MAKKIIILEQINLPSDSDYRYVFWANVPTARQPYYANPDFVSAYKDATTEEIAALRSGSVVEHVDVIPRPAGTTLNQLAAALITRFNTYQYQITNWNPYSRFGTYYDGSTWTSVGVA